MGCGDSKVRQGGPSRPLPPRGGPNSASTKVEGRANGPNEETSRVESKGSAPPEPEVNSTPVPTKPLGNGVDNSGAEKTNAPPTGSAPPAQNCSQQIELDDEGNALVLPKGEWVRTEGTPFYYSDAENLYFHPPSCQFYDPTNEMWYDPEQDEWYRDDDPAE
ncbi:hypothetical protein DPX39_100123000 [Trypanosoma brucei equiperdum]|uniref:OCRE domain-containing protein n=1 Tax=Trypanosoma brucei equiperdum TaxID=630700 RepID=A0A3L6KX14_9TRYP|nr:hypothetical protein DPX39_100123000 [Trypanosoma brucei equiperdum]